ESKKRTETVVGQVTPSVAELKQLNFLLQKSHTNISKWFYNKSFNDVEFRDELETIIQKDFHEQQRKLTVLSQGWSASEKEQLNMIFKRIETLFSVYKNEIMGQLSSTEA